MKRIAILATAVAVLSLAATSGAASRAHQAAAGTIQLRQTSLGKILTTAKGFTIYVFTRDSRNRDACASIGGCPSVWPLVRSVGRPTAGRGVSHALLGSTRVRGVTQATYAGHPLYTYSADSGPAQTGYVGVREFGGVWEAIGANGRLIK